MSEYRLVMKGVVKTFPGVKALDHAQLELRPGKVMALMGENGAGKSTLMKCMFGIYKILIAAYNHTCKRKTFAISDTLTFLSTLHSSISTLSVSPDACF